MRDTGRGMVASGGLSPLLGALYLTPSLSRRPGTTRSRPLAHGASTQ